MAPTENILAKRLGLPVHVSPLRMRLRRLQRLFPSSTAASLDDWLLDVANARGARVVIRQPCADTRFQPPPVAVLSNEELVVVICQLQSLDRPQWLRAAAQLISGNAVDPHRLSRLAQQERADVVLAEVARQALRVDARHAAWQALEQDLGSSPHPREPLLHWTRLAVPVPTLRRCNAEYWTLVA